MAEIVTVGIACDKYKIKKFEAELKKENFTDYEVKELTPETYIIKIKTHSGRIGEIHTLCKVVELHFKRAN